MERTALGCAEVSAAMALEAVHALRWRPFLLCAEKVGREKRQESISIAQSTILSPSQSD